MITYELQETRDVPVDGPRHPSVRVAGAEDVRDIRTARSVRSGAGRRPSPGVAVVARQGTSVRRGRPVPVRTAPGRTRSAARGVALCPGPVPLAPRAVVSAARYRMRRLVAGVGLALASGAVVFGLGLLADASAAANGAPASPVTVLHGF
ncbi:MAG: hypothetical protein ABW212_00205 [Pseudonocardia sediminis]